MRQMVCGGAPTGYVTSNDDCCDTDARAYPGQQTGYSAPANCTATGYDFNCDGLIEKGLTTIAGGVCCTLTAQPGWYGSVVPECGATADYIGCDEDLCVVVGGAVVQLCR